MAKSFKEIGKKAEALIEQGKEADRKVQSCQARVASSNNRVAAARRQLAAASETDENGNPAGNVEQARAQLSMAENQLAASQRALSSARGDADRVRQQKNAHVQEIERHNQVERSNLEKLRKLRAGAFGADSVALTEGMAQRLNEAEDARVALLRSMGIDATPDHVSVGGDGGADSGWRGGGFATLDTTGQAKSYQGGGSEGFSTVYGAPAPVGGGLQGDGFSTQSDSLSDAGHETQNMDRNTEAGNEAVKPLFGIGLFGKKNTPVQQQVTTVDFNGLVIENNGMAADKFFVKGNNYTRFSHFWNNYGQYTQFDSDHLATINARDIEGIFLNNNEAKDRFMFWNRNIEYPIDSETYFSRIASRIPEVQSRMNSGESVESIKQDPDLEACFDSYFDTPICVYEVDDYYYFAGSGRHRCMAAQKLGIDIPVRVIGEYRSNITNLNEVQDFTTLSVYMGARHGVRLSDSIGDLELTTVVGAISGLESVVKEYPEVGTLLTTGITSKSGVMACTGSKLSFNPDYFKDKSTLVSTCTDMSRQGFWIKNASPQSIGAHEAAHGVEWALIQANPQYLSETEKIKAWNDCSEAGKIVRQACTNIKNTEYGRGKTSTDLVRSISTYALQNDSETMAEAFADVYANGDNAKPLSKEIKKLTRLLMNNYKGGI